jgi:phospholipase C
VKLTHKLLLLVFLAGNVVSAQTVQHVIVVIQENRTPDNLFGSDLHNLSGRQLPNAHLVSTGKCKGMSQAVPLGPFELDAYCFDPDHGHGSWITTWDKNPNGSNGLMDGACQTNAGINGTCNNLPMCGNVPCPQYTYVDNKVLSGYHGGHNTLDGYFNVAINYGYANDMYQTNQGPSFPAHQFLFSGTSAPDTKDDLQGFYQYFAGENPLLSDGKSTGVTGCATAPTGSYVLEVAPDGSESKGYDPHETGTTPNAGYPCYDHPTMASLLDSNGIIWKYFNHAPIHNNTPGSSIWTAPNAIHDICYPIVNGQCTGTDWVNDVIEPPSKSDASPILDALGVNGECSLPQVSWVIPDGYWSDHPGTAGSDGGPAGLRPL